MSTPTQWSITTPTVPASQPPASRVAPVGMKWFYGFCGTWIVLAGLAELNDTQEFAAGLAVSIAIMASFLLLPDTVDKMKGVFS